MARVRKNDSDKHAKTIVWQVGAYIRLSREDGNSVSVSVQHQRTEIQAFLEQFNEPYDLVDFYIDDGCTGTDSNRAAFQSLLDDIRSQKVTCVIVRDPSRLSRNYLEAGMYMEQLFVRYNVRFISLALPQLDSYRNPEAMNSITVPIQNVINDDFCRQTSLKIRGVLNMKRARGEFIGGFAPYGYRKSAANKNQFIIDPDAALIVKDIFHWYVHKGLSKRAITKKLNQLGVPNPTTYKQLKGLNYQCSCKNQDGLWNPSTVSFILANEVYIGNMVQGRQRVKSYKVHDIVNVAKDEWFVVENTHEAIIDKETFALARFLQQTDTRTPPHQQTVHLFAGLLRCGDCGKGMRRCSGKQKVYYCCRTNKDKSGTACSRHTIREDILTNTVLTVIQTQLCLADDIQTIISEVEKEPSFQHRSKQLADALQRKKQALEKLDTVLENLYLDWKTGVITKAEYSKMHKSFGEKQAQMKTETADIQAEIALLTDRKHEESDYTTFLKHHNINRLNRSACVCFIRQILIHNHKHITVELNFADPFRNIIPH